MQERRRVGIVFELLDAFNDPKNRSVMEKSSAPGYWGSRSESHPFRTLVRNDLYEFELSEERSTVEFIIEQTLKKEVRFRLLRAASTERTRRPEMDGERWLVRTVLRRRVRCSSCQPRRAAARPSHEWSLTHPIGTHDSTQSIFQRTVCSHRPRREQHHHCRHQRG